MENVQMTDKEIEIMTAVYGDAERIREGRLFSHQVEALRQLRAGMEYLREKYPGHTLEILTFSPATKFSAHASFLLQGSTPDTCSMTVTPTDGSYVCADTYYGILLQEAYDARVGEVLTTGGYPAVSLTSFSTPAGMEVNEHTTVDELLVVEPKLTRLTHVYIAETNDPDAAVVAVQALLSEAGFYGAYFLYFVPADQFGDLNTMHANQAKWEYQGFSCYDVG